MMNSTLVHAFPDSEQRAARDRAYADRYAVLEVVRADRRERRARRRFRFPLGLRVRAASALRPRSAQCEL
jgi:hypothetical protein